jgi:hypothetical protein
MLRVSEIKPPLDHGADALKSVLQKKFAGQRACARCAIS